MMATTRDTPSPKVVNRPSLTSQARSVVLERSQITEGICPMFGCGRRVMAAVLLALGVVALSAPAMAGGLCSGKSHEVSSDALQTADTKTKTTKQSTGDAGG